MSIDTGGSTTTIDGTLTFDIPASVTSTMTITYTLKTTPTQNLADFEFVGLTFQLQKDFRRKVLVLRSKNL